MVDINIWVFLCNIILVVVLLTSLILLVFALVSRWSTVDKTLPHKRGETPVTSVNKVDTMRTYQLS